MKIFQIPKTPKPQENELGIVSNIIIKSHLLGVAADCKWLMGCLIIQGDQ